MRMSDAELQKAERQIERLIYMFAALNDAGQVERLAGLFAEDGAFSRPSDPDNPVRGRDAIRVHFAERQPRTTRHVMSNVQVTFLDSTRAAAHSYVTLFTGPAGDDTVPLTSVMIGDYNDELIRESGRWLFQTRSGLLRIRGKLDS